MNWEFVIVGAGLAGATIAERIATTMDKKVLVIDKRKHIGGNCFDHYNEHGILVHKYGPHTFHTKEKRVWEYLSQFTSWNLYQHRVVSYVDGMLVPFPINLTTLKLLYSTDFNPESMKAFLDSVAVRFPEIRNAEQYILSQIGIELYEKFFKRYTKKQWGIEASELDAEVLKRIPIRTNNDDRYFTDPYQGIPSNGYSEMVRNMLDHPNISLLLGVDYFDVKPMLSYHYLIYTGPIDAYFHHCHGYLGYRSLIFQPETYQKEYYLPCAAINYPNDYNFTRIREYKYMTGQIAPCTTIVKEYPVDISEDHDPYYPILTNKNKEIYKKYAVMAKKETDALFVGRLAEYKYYNMDQIVEKALDVFHTVIDGTPLVPKR